MIELVEQMSVLFIVHHIEDGRQEISAKGRWVPFDACNGIRFVRRTGKDEGQA